MKLIDLLKSAGFVPDTCDRAVVVTRDAGDDRINYFDGGDSFEVAFDADVTIAAKSKPKAATKVKYGEN